MFDNTNKMDKTIKIIGVIGMLLFPLAFIYKQFHLYTIIACLYIITAQLLQNIPNYRETKKIPRSIFLWMFILSYQVYLVLR